MKRPEHFLKFLKFSVLFPKTKCILTKLYVYILPDIQVNLYKIIFHYVSTIFKHKRTSNTCQNTVIFLNGLQKAKKFKQIEFASSYLLDN